MAIALRPFQRRFVAAALRPSVDIAVLSVARGNGKRLARGASGRAGAHSRRSPLPAGERTATGRVESRPGADYIERQNLTMRMSMRRYTRLTNGFSKKLENHAAATAIHFSFYNFARIHRTIRMSPAMKAGVTDRLWSIRDIVGLLEEHEAQEAA